jgi:cytochrome oxidase Cu insertion factor (SCO1/SenC/PrrC family)
MNTTIRGHNLRVTMVMALLAVLLLVAVVLAVWTAQTTSDRDANPANHAMSAEGEGGSSLSQDPIHRHVEVVDRLGNGGRR